MNVDQMIRNLNEGESDKLRLQMVDQLKHHLDDPVVVPAMCSAALKNISADLRNGIIGALKASRPDASRYFKKAATLCTSATIRKWAFLNLSLMGCQTAGSTVIQGLNDRNSEVRMAAALSIGLYSDQTFAAAVEGFLEKNRLCLLREGAHQLLAWLLIAIRALKKVARGPAQTSLQRAN